MAVAGADYYETQYGDYERQNPDAKLSFYLDLVRAHVAPGGRAFELGVGLGRFLERASREFDCAGVDSNPHGVARTRERVGVGVTVEVGSCEDIPAAPATDAVVAWDVLEHIPNLDHGLSTVRERLVVGGCLIGVVPVYDGPLGFVVRALDHDPTHVWKLGRAEWHERLTRCGFEIADWGGILRKLVLGRYYAHITRPQWLLRSVGSAIYFVARKT